MKTSTHRPSKFWGFVLLLALGGGGYFAFRALAGLFASLDVQVAIVTSVAALVVLSGAAAIAAAIKHAKRAESVHPMSGERGALYDRMLKAWAVLLGENGALADETTKKLNADLAALESGLALIASPEVIRIYRALRDARKKSPEQISELRSQLGRLMVAMRKDLVANKPDLDDNELLSVLLGTAARPATQTEQKVDFPAARSPEDLRPRISLAVRP